MGVVVECQACRGRRGDCSQEVLGDSHQHTQHKHSTQTTEGGRTDVCTCIKDMRTITNRMQNGVSHCYHSDTRHVTIVIEFNLFAGASAEVESVLHGIGCQHAQHLVDLWVPFINTRLK